MRVISPHSGSAALLQTAHNSLWNRADGLLQVELGVTQVSLTTLHRGWPGAELSLRGGPGRPLLKLLPLFSPRIPAQRSGKK
jgi:hypothetical protein